MLRGGCRTGSSLQCGRSSGYRNTERVANNHARPAGSNGYERATETKKTYCHHIYTSTHGWLIWLIGSYEIDRRCLTWVWANGFGRKIQRRGTLLYLFQQVEGGLQVTHPKHASKTRINHRPILLCPLCKWQQLPLSTKDRKQRYNYNNLLSKLSTTFEKIV